MADTLYLRFALTQVAVFGDAINGCESIPLTFEVGGHAYASVVPR